MMELFLRAVALYLILLLFMRAAGNRQFSQMTAFDAVLVIVIAEVTGQAFVGEDYSVTGAVVVIATLIALDIAFSLAKGRVVFLEHLIEGMPTILVSEGEVIKRNLAKERVREADILDAAREKHGLEAMDQVKYAVLDPRGEISIVPWPDKEP